MAAENETIMGIGYVKNAQITWKQNGWTLNAGLITTTQFKVQEDFWGKRYVMKSFQDEYKFGSSADLGVSVAYKFNKVVSADVIVANGEGYKKVQVKDVLRLVGDGDTPLLILELLNQKPDGIINIVDATNIERNLYLTLQLLELRVPMVLALNMMDEVRSNGGTIHYLMSDAAKFVTGTVAVVDGGFNIFAM